MASKPERYEGNWWILNGILFGIMLICITGVILPWISKETIDLRRLITVGLPIYIIGGLAFGLIMKLVYKYLDKDE